MIAYESLRPNESESAGREFKLFELTRVDEKA